MAVLVGLASTVIPSKSGGSAKTAGKLTSEWAHDNGSPASGTTAQVNIKDTPITKQVDKGSTKQP